MQQQSSAEVMVARDQLASVKSFTVQEIRNLSITGHLELRPSYQRNLVWSKEAKSYLIDTIRRGLPIPEIFASGSPEMKISIIDGQQRLSTVLEFLAGTLHLWVDNRVYGFEDFESGDKRAFLSYGLVFRMIPGGDGFLVRDIFQRINKYTTVLTPQEIRHAVSDSKLIRLAEKLAEDPFWRGSGLADPRSVMRMTNVQRVLELLLALEFGPLDGQNDSIDRYLGRHDASKLDDIAQSFRRTLERVKSIFGNEYFRYRFGRTDFYPLFVAISMLRVEKFSEEQGVKLRATLYALRKASRTESPSGMALEYKRAYHGSFATHAAERKAMVEVLLKVIKKEIGV